MKINLTQLSKQLNQAIAPFYMISGEEILLVNEACEEIVTHLKKQYELMPQRIHIGHHVDWASLHDDFNTLNLFNPVSCFVLTFSSLKWDTAAKEVLMHAAQHPHSQRFIILKLPKIEKETEKTKWFNALADACTWLPIPNILPNALPAWLSERAKRYHLHLSPEQAQWIAQRTENNLLASDQALQKLQLINQPITTALLEEVIEAQASYTIFLLSDACLAGNGPRVTRILDTLQQQAAAPLLVLWSLANDIRSAIQIHAALKKGKSFAQACQEQQICASRQTIIQHFISRSRPND
jgi:DNA polymerase-3 subunit delta